MVDFPTFSVDKLLMLVDLSTFYVFLLCTHCCVCQLDTKENDDDDNDSLTQNQCLQCVPSSSTHAEIPRLRDATELNNDGMIKLGYVHYQTEPNLSIFPTEI